MEGKRAEAIALALPRPALVSQELVWPLLVALSTAAAIVPFWASALLPYQDAPQHIAAVRAYLRQWIEAPVWHGPKVAELRRTVGDLTTRDAIKKWLDHAMDSNIDPL